jgi:hypothetical protein
MIKEIIDKLAEEDRRRLMYAFENEIPQSVKLVDGTFLGVHQALGEDSRIIQKAGYWTVWRKI